LTTIGAIANCRLSGLKSITLEEVDIENRELTYYVGKAKTFREPCKVKIPEWAIPAIASWISFLKENRPNATHLCCGDNGNAGVVADTTLTRPMRNMMKHFGFVTGSSKAGFHRFRASATNAAAKSGESFENISMGLLRYSDGGKMASQTYGHFVKDDIGNDTRSHWQDLIKPLGADVENIADALTVEVPEWEVLPADIKLMSNLRAIATGMLSNAFGDDYQRNPDADNPDINPYTDADLQAPAPSLHKCTYENGKVVSRDAMTGNITHEMESMTRTQHSATEAPCAGFEPATCGLTVRRSTS